MSTLTPDRTAASGHLALLADRTPWRTVLGLALALTAALALLLSAFAWPATQTRPRDVPVAVVGPPPAVEQVRTALESAQPGAFDVTAAVDAAQAQQLVLDREVSGALVLGPGGPSVVVATQAGPAVAQLLTQVAQGATGATVPVEDVAPPPADDPRGAGLAAGALPLSITGAVAGAVLALRVRGPGRRAAGAVVLALLAGPTAVGVLHGWLGALGGAWLAESAVVARTRPHDLRRLFRRTTRALALNGSTAKSDLGLPDAGPAGVLAGRTILPPSPTARLNAGAGLGHLLENSLARLIDPVDGAISKENRQLDEKNRAFKTRIGSLDKLLLSKRARLERQFANMESVLAGLQNQQQSLSAFQSLPTVAPRR